MGSQFDLIVVGAGHNGLVCAAYLAKSGLKTLVLEARKIVGGACVTEEIFPGYKISTTSYVPSMHPRIVEELTLDKFGYRVGEIDPTTFLPFPDGKYLLEYQDHEKTASEIMKFSKNDAEAYLTFSKYAADFYELIDALILSPPPPIPDLMSFIQGPEAEEVLNTFLLSSCKEVLNEYFESEYVKALLAFNSVLNTSMSPDTVGSAFMLALDLAGSGYQFAYGGMGTVSGSIARAAEHYGAVIRTGAVVRRILVKHGKAMGVELDSGEMIPSTLVVSNADPKRTFLKLIGEEHLDKAFGRKIRALNSTGTSLKINLALTEPPDFKVFPGKTLGPHHRAFMHIAPTIEYVEKAYDACKYGALPEKPPIDSFMQSAYDPSVCPPGTHTLSLISKYNPYHLKKGNWDELKEEATGRAINTFNKYAPNFADSIIQRHTLTPLDLEREFYLTEGNVTHIDQTLNQMLSFRPVEGWANYRTPIANLYLCGAGTHPGGGVRGAPGHNAAKVILEDWSKIQKSS